MACIFCSIIDGDATRSLVLDMPRVMAFMDIGPINTGHVLVVPKVHAPRLGDLEPETGAELFTVAQRVAAALYASALRSEGVNVLLSDGEVAGQEVMHVHLHVVPRFQGDGFVIRNDFRRASRQDLDASAAVIRAAWDA